MADDDLLGVDLMEMENKQAQEMGMAKVTTSDQKSGRNKKSGVKRNVPLNIINRKWYASYGLSNKAYDFVGFSTES